MQALHRFLSGGMMAMGAMSGLAVTPNTPSNSTSSNSTSSSSNNNSSTNNNISNSNINQNDSTTSSQGLGHVHGPNCNHPLSHSHSDNTHVDTSSPPSVSSSSSSSSGVVTGGLDHDHAHEGGHHVEDAAATTTTKESALLQGLEFESDNGDLIDASVVEVGGSGGAVVVDPTEAERRMQSKTPDVAFGKAASIIR